ncbi:hypothetical protein GQF42_16135 [Streptomyces broussonetiae]|uniref:DUF1918 domain-containing protein n=1 Tax=Streptomyces broussonetiae TaxID=2686304 RepID=A0A6I6MV82_9ACTN|nr:hypothetical protein [Streptomyces broussonetiae]QHA04618.1 hypothetical protein GQF42_16135 [Streptomyces broussonetiae]
MTIEKSPWVGDQVHDEDAGREGVVTDVQGGTYILRPLAGGGGEWASTTPKRLRVTVPRSRRV